MCYPVFCAVPPGLKEGIMRKLNYIDRSNSTPQGGEVKAEEVTKAAEVVPAKAPKKKEAPAEEVVAEEVVAEKEEEKEDAAALSGIKGISILPLESD